MVSANSRAAVLASIGVLSSCGVGPPPVVWSEDLAAALATIADPDGLAVVHFAMPGATESEAMTRDTLPDPAVRRAIDGLAAVRLVAVDRAKTYREVFDRNPGLATCVMNRRGVAVAAHEGFLDAIRFARFVERAKALAPAVARAEAAFRSLPMRGQRAARTKAASRLADAYLESGNRVAARRYYTLVTLLRPTRARDSGHDLTVRACERLARLEIERGNHLEAREWLEHLKDERGDAATAGRVQLTEAMIALSEHRVDAACAILERLRADPHHDEPDLVLYEYSRACRESGRAAAARRALHAVLTKYPDSPVGQRARADLDHR